MALSPPTWKTARRLALAAALVLVAVLAGLRLLAASPLARNLVEERIEATTIRGQTLTLDGLKGDLLGRLSVEQITVRDENGTWLVVRDLDVNWSPLALLSGQVKAGEVHAGEAEMARRPVLSPSAPSSGSSSSFISTYRIDAFGLDALTLAEGVAGPSQSYRVAGHARIGGPKADIALDLNPLSETGDVLALSAEWGRNKPLTGRADLEAEAGGLVATLLDTPEGAPVTAHFKAASEEAGWSMTAASRIGQTDALSASAQLHGSELVFEGRADLSPLGRLAALTARLGPGIDFSGAWDTKGPLVLTLKSESLGARLSAEHVKTSGGISLSGLKASLAQIDAPRLTGSKDLDLPELALAGDLAYAASEAVFEGEITAPALGYRDFRLQKVRSSGRHAYRSGAITLLSEGTVEDVSGLSGQAGELLRGPLTLSSDATLTLRALEADLRTLEVRNQPVALSAKGKASLRGPLNLSGTAALKNISRIEEMQATWRLTGAKPETLRLVADATLTPDIEAGALGNFLQAPLTVHLKATRNGAAGYVIEAARLKGQDLSLTASGEIAGKTLTLDGMLGLENMSLSGFEAGRLETSFATSGPFDGLALTTRTTGAGLALFGTPLESPRLEARLQTGPDITFDTTFSAGILDHPLSLTSKGAYVQNGIRLDQLTLDWSELTADVSGRVNTENPEASNLQVDFSGEVPALGNVTGLGKFTDGRMSTSLSVARISYGPAWVNSGQLDISGTWPEFSGMIDVSGDLELAGLDQPMTAALPLRLNAAERSLSVAGAISIAQEEIRLLDPLEVSLADGLTLRGRAGAFDGELAFAVTQADTSTATLTVSNMSLRQIGRLLQQPGFRGDLNARAELDLNGGALNGQLGAHLTGFARQGLGLSDTRLSLDGTITDNQLVAHMAASDADGALNFGADAALELVARETVFSIRLAPGRPVPVTIKGDGTVAPILALALPQDLRIEGNLDVDISNGTGETFGFSGALDFSDGVFEDGTTGVHLKEIKVRAALDPDGIDILDAKGKGAKGGRLSASGRYGFDGTSQVSVTARELDAITREDFTAIVSGKGALSRKNNATVISGDIEINRADIDFSSMQSGGYATLDVDFSDNPEEAADTSHPRNATTLDLTVSADRRVFVRGPSLDSEWGVGARVTGSPASPRVVGEARLVRGSADLLSRRFAFSEGTIRFTGPLAATEFRVAADRTSDGITSTLTISGSVQDPQIALSSDPSLPEDEILARVLFGSSASELSALQAAQLAGAAAQLAGGRPVGLVGNLQSATGLDRLDLQFGENGDATLATGKYLADDVYLEIQSSVSGAPGLVLEWTPMDNVEVEADIDPEDGPRIAVQWQRDFDSLPGTSGPDE